MVDVRRDRVDLRGVGLFEGGREAGEPVAVLQRCEPEGLRLWVKDETVLLSAPAEVSVGWLDLSDGRLSLDLTPDGQKRLAAESNSLVGQGFTLATSKADLDRRETAGIRRLHLSTMGLHPAGRPEDALVISFEHFSAEGVVFHLPQASSATVPWSDIDRAGLDLLTFQLEVVFSEEALDRYNWLSGIREFEGNVRRPGRTAR